jgi:transposase
MVYATILGTDLGKFKSVCCAMDAASGEHDFQTLETTPAAVKTLLVKHASAERSVLLVVEACDAAGWVHDVGSANQGVTVTVVHTQGDERWRWRKVKRKSDRDDALKLARLARLGELPQPPVHVPSPERRQWRRLVLHRRSVVTRRTQCRNAIRSIYSQQGLSLARGNKQWTRAGVAQLKADARALDGEQCAVLDLWRGRLHAEMALMEAVDQQLKVIDAKLDQLADADPRIALLRSVKGVGPRLAEAVVLHIGDDPRRFKSGQQLAGYAGLVPKLLESGQTTRLGHITRRGPALLRSLLVEAAWMVYRLNDWARAFVEKVSRGGRGRRKLAIVALARKLLILLWGMLKSNKPFRDPTARTPKEKTPKEAAPQMAAMA